MRVTLNQNISEEFFKLRHDEEKKRYFGLKTGRWPEREAEVYGILFSGKNKLLLLCEYDNPELFGFYNIDFFELIDRTVPPYWKFYTNISHRNIVYSDVDMQNFDFIGVDRFVNEENFFLNYHSDGREEIEYMTKIYKKYETRRSSGSFD